MDTKNFKYTLRLFVVLATLSCGSALAQPVSIHPIAVVQAGQNAPVAQGARKLDITLFGRSVNLTLDVGTLGLIVILALLVLSFTAICLAILARRRTRQGQAANRKLQEEIAQRQRAEDETCQLNDTLEQRVAERTTELESSNMELDAFAYSVSHDLRAPLRHLSGYAEMLQKSSGELLNVDSQRYLEVILESAARMGNLIDHLLAFSRLGRTELQKARISLDEVLKHSLNDLKEETNGRDVLWSIQDLPEVNADGALLRMVFVNLLSNALKFTSHQQQAEIEIACKQNNGELVVLVRDNGAGFDMKYVDKLFGVFQRLHRADQFEGTGIGLANVKRIILRHGGKTWAESREGEGATFYFSLPFTEREGSCPVATFLPPALRDKSQIQARA
jgi:signal transduction histidine kinase